MRSFWVRTRIGNLAAAMPRLRKEFAAAENAIMESNSILGFLRPDLYLSVLDHATADFKDSARLFLDRADALLVHAGSEHLVPQWRGVSPRLREGIPRFPIAPPEYVTDAVIAFVEKRLAVHGCDAGQELVRKRLTHRHETGRVERYSSPLPPVRINRRFVIASQAANGRLS